ncbi:hypothetical protein L6R50_09310 [Myxococcota bacterium]|nr:hypothetical protein [Myxococcota bacterium]
MPAHRPAALVACLLLLPSCSDYLLGGPPGDGDPDDDSAPDDDTGLPGDDDDGEDEGTLTPTECHTEDSTVGTFDPAVEWHWPHLSWDPTYAQVIATPIVTHLTDDDGDGDYDGDDMPTIVVPVVRLNLFDVDPGGGLVALRGDGTELWWYSTGDDVNAYTAPAAGDLDGDGDIELVVGLTGKRLAVIDHEGQKVAESGALSSGFPWTPVPALADLDGDGTPEVIAGRNVLHADLSLRWSKVFGSEGANAWVSISAVADLDMDGSPDVVAGNTAYRADGSTLWTSAAPDGFPAIGDFDLDGDPEVVLVSNSQVYLVDGADGSVIWGPKAIDGYGGAPTVADVDGDGEPEIGVAGLAWFWCLETDGSTKWRSAQQDLSSAATGSSVFDFEGDGRAELVYGDELRVRIFDGSDGSVRYEIDNPNGTAWENPTIADVDRDGNAEVVIVASTYQSGTTTGVRVIGDLNDSWVPTRSVWNQHTYHVGNTLEDGTIPSHEDPSWVVHNSYRLNQLGEGGDVFVPLPDLVVMDVDLDASDCPEAAALRVQVGNQGEAEAPAGVPVTVYLGPTPDPLQVLATGQTVSPLEPMGWEWLYLPFAPGMVSGGAELTAVVDDVGNGTGVVTECNEKNNARWESVAGCP